jgi:hypothetical protein
MTRENWWIAAKVFLGLPVLFYALLSILEPQREIWRKPTKRVLMTFIVAWGTAFALAVLILAWNALR